MMGSLTILCLSKMAIWLTFDECCGQGEDFKPGVGFRVTPMNLRPQSVLVMGGNIDLQRRSQWRQIRPNHPPNRNLRRSMW